jgi:hypothetical protein
MVTDGTGESDQRLIGLGAGAGITTGRGTDIGTALKLRVNIGPGHHPSDEAAARYETATDMSLEGHSLLSPNNVPQ